jgi:hypothetical protein
MLYRGFEEVSTKYYFFQYVFTITVDKMTNANELRHPFLIKCFNDDISVDILLIFPSCYTTPSPHIRVHELGPENHNYSINYKM